MRSQTFRVVAPTPAGLATLYFAGFGSGLAARLPRFTRHPDRAAPFDSMDAATLTMALLAPIRGQGALIAEAARTTARVEA